MATPPHSRSFDGIGTSWIVSTGEPLSDSRFAELLGIVEEYDRTYSRFRADSVVTRLATTAGPAPFPPDAGELFGLYEKLYRLTAGGVTPLVGASLERLGYDAAYSLRASGDAVASPAWDDTLVLDRGTVTLRRPALLDVGAAGKGQLVDLLAERLKTWGYEERTVDGSGDLRHSGGASLRIALEHPFDPTRAIGVVELADGALCASSIGRRAWGNGFHHVLDGRTGVPVDTVAATWVLAETALLADGLATALFLADPDELATEFAFRYVVLHTDGRVRFSADLPGEVFTA